MPFKSLKKNLGKLAVSNFYSKTIFGSFEAANKEKDLFSIKGLIGNFVQFFESFFPPNRPSALDFATSHCQASVCF